MINSSNLSMKMRTNNKHIQMRLQVQKCLKQITNPELDKVTIEQAINNINSAINNLNSEAKLTKAKRRCCCFNKQPKRIN